MVGGRQLARDAGDAGRWALGRVLQSAAALPLWLPPLPPLLPLPSRPLPHQWPSSPSVLDHRGPPPAGGVVEYKYVLLDHSGQHAVAWQRGNNSVLALRAADEFVEVFDNWCAVPRPARLPAYLLRSQESTPKMSRARFPAQRWGLRQLRANGRCGM